MVDLHTRTLSPKEVAQVIGVSESSIKRWVDDGLIDVIRTAGGHRRITVGDALRFVRKQGMRVLFPELIGLPDVRDLPVESREGKLTGDVLYTLLKESDPVRARAAITNAFLSGQTLADLFDGPIREALTRFGDLWHVEKTGIYHEHVASNICIEAINQIRGLLPVPKQSAPLALGGSPEWDPYILPSLMVATIFAEVGYKEINLGAATPWYTFQLAAEANEPEVVWISVTAYGGKIRSLHEFQNLLDWMHQRSIKVVMGGQAAATLEEFDHTPIFHLSSMNDLYTLIISQDTAERVDPPR